METQQIPRGHQATRARRRTEREQMIPPDARGSDLTRAKHLQMTSRVRTRTTRREATP